MMGGKILNEICGQHALVSIKMSQRKQLTMDGCYSDLFLISYLQAKWAALGSEPVGYFSIPAHNLSSTFLRFQEGD